MDMRKWLREIKESPVKKPMPILSFPCVQLLDARVDQLVSDSSTQAAGMKAVADRVDSLASVSFMDLSLEAQAFGAEVKMFEMEVPTITGILVRDQEDAEKLEIPSLEAGRLMVYIEGMKKALSLIQDRPVFAGVIGPFSLAGRLVDVNKAMIYCKKNPLLLHTVLEKATEFLIQYIQAYKETGANGIVMAEPLAGLISPRLAEKFSAPYVRRIAEAVKDQEFLVIYHNCGNAALKMAESIKNTGCDAYHFGNAIDMKAMMEQFPEDIVVMGNIDPVQQFAKGTPESMRQAVEELLAQCSVYPNFVISSGCDIPPEADWENIDAFFAAVKDFYNGK
ncbi:uroporphyrinogen decarboxylase family protein [bacterium 210820-DFI.6.37]|nr:uroporphyrinogen decarboxylase family protein [bacterium 210820-DFI.6.37]